MRHFDNDALATFVTIIECNSFTAAADKLGKTQAAVSLILGRLEQRIGHKLIERSKSRKMTLTAYGETLIGYARQILDIEEKAMAAMDCDNQNTRIRIGMPDDYAEVFANLPLLDFSKRFSNVEVEIYCDFSCRLEEDLENGTIDLAIITRSPGTKTGIPLVNITQSWCAPPDSVPEVEAITPLVLFSEQCRSRPTVLATLQKASRPYKIVSSSSHLPAVLATARSTPAITVLPSHVIPSGWRTIKNNDKFPKLPDLEIALVVPDNARLVARQFGYFVEAHFKMHDQVA